MIHFLAIQSTYQAVECALFRQNTIIEQCIIPKTIASSTLIPAIIALLERHNLRLQTLDFIAVNRGPAPFTTLRVVITTMNGLRYACGIPLVGVNGFDAWFNQFPDQGIDTAIILDAFNKDVYIGFRAAHTAMYSSGYGPAEIIAQQLAQKNAKSMYLMGNGFILYRTLFEQYLTDSIKSIGSDQLSSSLYHVGLVGLQQWQAGMFTHEALVPVYLKTAAPTFNLQK